MGHLALVQTTFALLERHNYYRSQNPSGQLLTTSPISKYFTNDHFLPIQARTHNFSFPQPNDLG